jgi:hypothetical protein
VWRSEQKSARAWNARGHPRELQSPGGVGSSNATACGIDCRPASVGVGRVADLTLPHGRKERWKSWWKPRRFSSGKNFYSREIQTSTFLVRARKVFKTHCPYRKESSGPFSGRLPRDVFKVSGVSFRGARSDIPPTACRAVHAVQTAVSNSLFGERLRVHASWVLQTWSALDRLLAHSAGASSPIPLAWRRWYKGGREIWR